MDDLVRTTLELASVFARNQRARFGEEWFEEFQQAIQSEDLQLVHDLLLDGIRRTQGDDGLGQMLSLIDEDVAALHSQNRTLH